jgi:hypothetical protein
MRTLFYPMLGSFYDLRFLRLSGSGIGNGFYAYFHAMVLSEQYDGQIITPAWVSLKAGPIIRREHSKRTYFGVFKPHADEIYGIRKLGAFIARYSNKNVVEIGTNVEKRVMRNEINFVVCRDFTFVGLHERLDAIRRRLVEICGGSAAEEPNWGRGGFVGVHVRLGDFSEPKDIKEIETGSTNKRIPMTWYGDIIDQIKARYPDLPIRVFSDGSEEELRVILARGATLHRTGTDIGDLIGLATASILVGSNSTYSRWAAFLGDMPSIWLATSKTQERPTSMWTPLEYASVMEPKINWANFKI